MSKKRPDRAIVSTSTQGVWTVSAWDIINSEVGRKGLRETIEMLDRIKSKKEEAESSNPVPATG